MLVLSVIQGPGKGKTFNLPNHEPQLLGRSSEALPIDDNAISRRHAELTPDDGVWYIRDLESQNGTYVNGTRIWQRERLRPGDQIRVGQSVLVFGVTETKAAESVRVVGKDRLTPTVERSLPSYALSEKTLTPRDDKKPPKPANGGTRSTTPANVPSNPNDDSVILAEPEPRAAAMDHLRIIYRLTSMLTERVMDRAQLLEGVMDLVFSEFHPQRGCIMLVDETNDQRYLPAAVRYRDAVLAVEDQKIHVSRTILQHVITKSEGILSSNAMTDPRFAKGDSVQRLSIRSAICSPIRFRDKTYGAIYIDSSVANYTFTAEQLALMNAVGQHAGLALANAQLYQEKLQAERLAAIGETVATLSHSIKNILQGLRGGADVVEMGLSKDDLKIAKGGWPILHRNLSRIVSLTLNMLAFSRQRRIEPELAQLSGIIDDCVEILEPQTRGKQVALVVDIDSETPPVPIDPPLLHQALMNLITNAIEAVKPEEGIVTVRVVYRPQGSKRTNGTTVSHAEVDIAVIDNGAGIPQAKQRWIFEPFHTTKGVKGTGLGLAVAKRVAQQHGGTLTLTSDEGKGATFRMVLPADGSSMLDPSATHT
ncbi:MAG TPA: ATP-binding protein [Phycisphaerales bacterium]|nr:ATP-binding protein [Phycisphaerales bacterium]